MRTLIFLFICGLCVTVAVMECRDRSNFKKTAFHAASGLVIGFIIWKLIVRAGVFDGW
jgi:hypothetical protein